MKQLLVLFLFFLVPICCLADDWTQWDQLNDGALNGIEFSHRNECSAAMKGPNCTLQWRFLSNYEEPVMVEYTIAWDVGNQLKSEHRRITLQPGENSCTSFTVSGADLEEISVRVVTDPKLVQEAEPTRTEPQPAPLTEKEQEELRRAKRAKQQEQEDLRRAEKAQQQEELTRLAEKVKKQQQDELNRAAVKAEKQEELTRAAEKVEKQKQEELNRAADSAQKQEELSRAAEKIETRKREELKQVAEKAQKQEELSRAAAKAEKQRHEELSRAAEKAQKQEELARAAVKAEKQKQEELSLATEKAKQQEELSRAAEKAQQQQQEELIKAAEKAQQQEQEELILAEKARQQEQEKLRRAKRARQQEQEDLRRAEKARQLEPVELKTEELKKKTHVNAALPPQQREETKQKEEPQRLQLSQARRVIDRASPSTPRGDGGESDEKKQYALVKPATDCISTFSNININNWLAYRNNCSYAVHVFYSNPGFGSIDIAPDQVETSGWECEEGCTPSFGACPAGYTVLNTAMEPYTSQMQRGRDPFICGKLK